MSTQTIAPPDAPHIAIHISPDGEEWYSAYGPLTKDRDKAMRYVSATVANLAVQNRIGNGAAFWPSEIHSASLARKEYAGWTFRIEPA